MKQFSGFPVPTQGQQDFHSAAFRFDSLGPFTAADDRLWFPHPLGGLGMEVLFPARCLLRHIILISNFGIFRDEISAELSDGSTVATALPASFATPARLILPFSGTRVWLEIVRWFPPAITVP